MPRERCVLFAEVPGFYAAVERAVARGAEVLADRSASGVQVIRDPSGAVCALYGKP